MPSDEFQKTMYNVINNNLPMQSAMDIPADKFSSSEEYGIISLCQSSLVDVPFRNFNWSG